MDCEKFGKLCAGLPCLSEAATMIGSAWLSADLAAAITWTLSLSPRDRECPKSPPIPNPAQSNEFWVQLIFMLGSRSRGKKVYEYVPHLCFAHIEPERDSQYQRGFKAEQFDITILVGATSYLDTIPFKRKGSQPSYRCDYHASAFNERRNYCYCVIDDWLITIVFRKGVAEEMDVLFEGSDSKHAEVLAALWELLNRKSRVALSLEKGTTAAARIARQFERHLQR